MALATEYVLFLATLPFWILGAKLHELYDRDEERTDHSTTDELARVFVMATVGVFVVARAVTLAGGHEPDQTKMTVFWALLIAANMITIAFLRGVRARSR